MTYAYKNKAKKKDMAAMWVRGAGVAGYRIKVAKEGCEGKVRKDIRSPF